MAISKMLNAVQGFDHAYRDEIVSDRLAQGIDLDEVKNHLSLMSDDRFASVLYARSHTHSYLQPRGGFPTFGQQKELTECLDLAGADFIPLTIDSYTRHNDYDKAQHLLGKSESEGRCFLNGYPLISHGYELTRMLFMNIERPVCLRHGTPDARLLVEVAIASGITEIEGGALSYCLPYSTDFPLDRSLLHWQYVDQVCAYYSTPERPISRESFGPLTATMVPPMMVVVVELLEMLLAIEQGVTSFSLSFSQTGSFVQDVALGRVLGKMSRTYLEELGFDNVSTQLVYHQWMGPYPRDRRKASALTALSSVVAQLVAPDKIVTKTEEEAFGIPTIKANCQALGDVRYILEKFPVADLVSSDLILEEEALITREVNHLMDIIMGLSGDMLWDSVYQALCHGYLDVPFSPHQINPNKLITERDRSGAIRIVDPGMVPVGSGDLRMEQELLESNRDTCGSFIDKAMKDIYLMV